MYAGSATISQCVILTTDLRQCGGRPLLFWLLREFIRYGVTDFLLPASSAAEERAIAAVQAMLPRPVRIGFALGPAEAGTGGALLHARAQLQDRFLVCGGGKLFDSNLAALLAESAADSSATVGRVAVDGHVVAARRTLLDHLRPGCSLQARVLPELMQRGLVLGGRDGGPPAAAARQDLPAALCRRALFLDRDGVINIDHGYVGSRDRFEWVAGAREAIRYATEAGWHVFIVTNQSGVARGLFGEGEVRELLDWIADQARIAGGNIDDVRFCPFHPEATLPRYRRQHPWRKPMPGMLLDLIASWELEAGRAVMVGDQETDIQAAAAARVAGHRFPGGNLLEFLRPILTEHDHVD